MMQLCGALILFISVSAVCGLRCYTCTATEPRSCTDTKSCSVIFNRCFSLRVEGYDMITKGCQTSIACVGSMACCEGDLCNNATHAESSVILLVLLLTSIMSTLLL